MIHHQWSSGQSSRKRPEFPTWNSELDDRSKRIFLVRAPFFSEISVVLNSLKSEISQFRVSSCFWMQQKSCWIDVYPFKLGKETLKLNPDLDHTPTPLNSRLVIALQCLQLATDSFQTTQCWICDFQLDVSFLYPMADGRLYPMAVLSKIYLHMTRIGKDLPVDCLLHDDDC